MKNALCVAHAVMALLACCLSVILFMPGPGYTQPPSGVENALSQTATQTPESTFIQNLGDKSIAITVDKSLTSEEMNAEYRKLLDGAFDMKTIGAFVLGRTWKRLTPAQKSEYLDLFNKLTIKTYTEKLRTYSGEKFLVTDVYAQGKETTVKTQILHPDSRPPTEVDWVVRRDASGDFAIIDVLINGISQSVTQRNVFSSILERNNDNIVALLSAMRRKAE